jgi:hypothetical protein
MRRSRFNARRLRRAGAIAAAVTCLLLAGCGARKPEVDDRALFNPYYYSGRVPENLNPLSG